MLGSWIMESQALGEQIEWEVRHVAAAFGVEAWEKAKLDEGCLTLDSAEFSCVVSLSRNCVIAFCTHTGDSYCDIHTRGLESALFELLECRSSSTCISRMARGLYRFGFKDESVLSQLPELTDHEKLELRRSMPREFWPQKWLDEEPL